MKQATSSTQRSDNDGNKENHIFLYATICDIEIHTSDVPKAFSSIKRWPFLVASKLWTWVSPDPSYIYEVFNFPYDLKKKNIFIDF